ncbi:MAG TPA: beta-propeller fold lactonase family protein, partial [Solirubrobacteraceae bacterium]|nr:beta-propeller fold lactonase family protein [Solirubrobacteraceae bacterium]
MSGLHGLVVSPDGTDVYAVGHPSGTGQVVELQRDPATGAVTDIGCIAESGSDGCTTGKGLNGAAGIAISPDGTDVYVAADASNAVVAFTRNTSTGVLTESGCLAVAAVEGCTAATGLTGATGIAVSPNGANVYVTSEESNSVAVFSRNSSSGALTETGCIAESGAGGCTAGTGLSHAENVAVSPNGANVYVTALDGNAVVTFARNTSTGALTQSGCIAESGADGCTSGNGLDGADGIVVSPDGSNVYVAAENSNALVTFARSSSGVLTEQSCVAETAGDSCTQVSGLTGAARVAVSPDGDNVYVAGYTANTLVTFSRGFAGAVTVQGTCVGASGNSDGCTATAGLTAPAALGISPDGHTLYTGALTSNAIDAFERSEPYPSPSGQPAPAPASMAGLGDSFTQAAYSAGSCSPTADCPANSWATGTTASVDSEYQRLTAIQPALAGNAVNRAVDAKNMSYLDTEVKAAIPSAPQYVTILMGLNDVCGGSMTVSTMTPTATFASEFQTAMSDLTSHLPNTNVFVASIPNPYRLWQILHTNSAATSAWNSQGICPAMLANPTSMAQADVSRRATVLAQVVSDNQQLQQICGQYVHCQFDGDAVFNWEFSPYDINTTDYFHPSLQGQADLAQVTYQSGFAFTSTPLAPAVTTSPATSLSGTGATLNGTVNPENQSTTYYFQYGPAGSFTSTTPVQSAGSGTTTESESAAVTGLAPGNGYQFRLVATNATGTTDGATTTFATSSPQGSYASTVLANGPVSYWRLNETSGTTAADQEGVNPGTYSGGYTLGAPGPMSSDAAVTLNGSTGYVKVPASASLNTADTFSLEAWVKLAKLGSTEGLFGKGSYMFFINASNDLELYQPSVGPIATSTAGISSTAGWHYVVATKSGASVHLYLDGVDVTGTVTNRTIASSTAALDIGAGAAYLDGSISEVAVYNKVLTPAQVQADYVAAEGPLANTNAASGVGQATATLNGTVNPQGHSTTYYFEYGPSASYGQLTATTSAGSGTSSVPVSASLTGLAAGTPYHYQLVATSATGTTYGGDQTFTTSGSAQEPTAVTGQATAV